MKKGKKAETKVSKDGAFIAHVQRFATEEACLAYLEKRRWPKGPVCPHCKGTRQYKLKGESTRKGLYKCADCRKPYRVTMGTIFEGSKIPLPKWFATVYLVMCSKKSISAHQLHRMLGITYKSAWFMFHRIRHAFRTRKGKTLWGTVEADETYVGGKNKPGKRGRGAAGKTIVLGLAQRKKGLVAKVVKNVSAKTLGEAIRQNVRLGSWLMTDELASYAGLGRDYRHETVNHANGEYVRGDAHVNSSESWFALLLRGIHGTFHHVSAEKLPLYADEFAFRYTHRKTTDGKRFDRAFDDVTGRLRWYFKPAVHESA